MVSLGEVPESTATEFVVGEWRVQHSRNRIVRGANRVHGDSVHLEPMQASLLLFLAQHAGEVVTKAEILEGVWGSLFVSDSALTRTIATLRRSLGDDARAPRYIETIHKRGYRLMPTVVWVERASDRRGRAKAGLAVLLAAAAVAAVVMGAVAMGAVAVGVRGSSGDARLTGSRPVDPEALDLYLRGRDELNRCEKQGPNRAEELFTAAIEADPTYAPAHSGLADTFTRLYNSAYLSADEALPRARAAALTALALDDQLAEAHASLAKVSFYYDWDWEEAESRFQEAIRLDPSQPEVREKYAIFLVSMGRFTDALVQSRLAVALDPLSERRIQEQAWVYFNAKRYDEAIAALTPAIVKAAPAARLYLAWAHSLRGDLEVADRIYRELLAEDEKQGSPILLATYGWNLARMGRVEGAAEIVRLVSLSPSVEIDPYPLAILYAGMGDQENALLEVERAFAQRSPNMIYLGIEPFLDPIRGHSRFESLRGQLRL